jgi:DNA-binding transcriptional MerR regulator
MLTIGEFARLGQVSPRMLRHYDQIGLLTPDHVDRQTGYRSYAIAQLGRLHRLLALRDLGCSLEQICQLLDDDPPVEQLRGMLRLRQVQIEQSVAEEQARLRRVEAHLRILERRVGMSTINVVIKTAEAVRIAEVAELAPGFGHENLGPVFERAVPRLLGALGQQGVTPRMMIAWYEEPADDGSVVAHIGFDIGNQKVTDTDGVSVVDLPAVNVASAVYRGTMEGMSSAYESLIGWIEDSGHRLAGRSRELYLEWDNDQPERSTTELQVPVD